MRAPAFFVFLETALGPMPQSAILPTIGRLRRRSNPAGRFRGSPIDGKATP